MIRTLFALLGLTLVLALFAGPGVPASTPPASGNAYALRVSAPGQPGGVVASIGGSTSTTGSAGGYQYPADGSVARIGPAATTLTVQTGGKASVVTGADVSSVVLFNGEITADGVSVRAGATADTKEATASTDGSTVRNLVALGQVLPATPGASAALADWGSITVLSGSTDESDADDTNTGKASMLGFRVALTQAHGGLPAGSEIVVGYADASVAAAVPPPPPTTTTTPTPTPTTTVKPPSATTAAEAARAAARAVRGNRRPLPTAPEPKGGVDGAPAPPSFRPPPAGIDAELTPGRYVFPVYGPVGFGDTFGAARASTGWHHGEDIFGTLGQPILAVADGTIFSVGWNDVGGYRLWLRDRYGNQYYYAHLSAYSSLAVNGREVRAGQVIAFMGNTGEAITTPVHLHFEIHPVSMLQFGYDGAIDPHPYLTGWQRLQDVPFAAGAGWIPVLPVRANAPRPGAILLQSSDISSATGLDPASLARALVAPSAGGVGGLAAAAAPAPATADAGAG